MAKTLRPLQDTILPAGIEVTNANKCPYDGQGCLISHNMHQMWLHGIKYLADNKINKTFLCSETVRCEIDPEHCQRYLEIQRNQKSH